jgi:hypothetical protein
MEPPGIVGPDFTGGAHKTRALSPLWIRQVEASSSHAECVYRARPRVREERTVAATLDSPPPLMVGGQGRVEGTRHCARIVHVRLIGRVSHGSPGNCLLECGDPPLTLLFRNWCSALRHYR